MEPGPNFNKPFQSIHGNFRVFSHYFLLWLLKLFCFIKFLNFFKCSWCLKLSMGLDIKATLLLMTLWLSQEGVAIQVRWTFKSYVKGSSLISVKYKILNIFFTPFDLLQVHVILISVTFARGKIWKRIILIGQFMDVEPHHQAQDLPQTTLNKMPMDCMLI